MRNNWTEPNDVGDADTIFNCCLFRMIGTSEFAEAHGWVKDKWDSSYTKALIQDRIDNKLRTFTGAYIITNQGIKAPKSEIVVDHFLRPIWENREKILKRMLFPSEHCSLQKAHQELSNYRGWGGGGFMAYEVVTDLNYTKVLRRANDKMTWANAGPGAVRGLNRIYNRPLNKSLNQDQANIEMRKLLHLVSQHEHTLKDTPIKNIDMRTIEHSLCEWDKYQRIHLKQGRPRSKFDHHISFMNPLTKGSVL